MTINVEPDLITIQVPKMSGLSTFKEEIRQHLKQVTSTEPDEETMKSFENIFRSNTIKDHQILTRALFALHMEYNSLLDSRNTSEEDEDDFSLNEVRKNEGIIHHDRSKKQDLGSYMVAVNLLMTIFQAGFFDQNQMIFQIFVSLIERPFCTSTCTSAVEEFPSEDKWPTLHSVITHMCQHANRTKSHLESIDLEHISVALFFSVYAASRYDIVMFMKKISKSKQQEGKEEKDDTSTVKKLYKEHILFMSKYVTYKNATEIMEIGSKVYKMAYVLDPEGVMGVFILHWLKVDYSYLKSFSVNSLEAFIQFCTTNKDVLSSSEFEPSSTISHIDQLKIRMAHFVGRVLVPFIPNTLRQVLYEGSCTNILPASLKNHLFSVKGMYDLNNVQQIGLRFFAKKIVLATKYFVDSRYWYLKKEENFEGIIEMDHNKIILRPIKLDWSIHQFSKFAAPLYLSYFVWWLEMQNIWMNIEGNEFNLTKEDLPRRLFQHVESEETDWWLVSVLNKMRQIQGFSMTVLHSNQSPLPACPFIVSTIDSLFKIHDFATNEYSELHRNDAFWLIVWACSKLQQPKDLIDWMKTDARNHVTFSNSQEKFIELFQIFAKTKKCIFARHDVISLFDVRKENMGWAPEEE